MEKLELKQMVERLSELHNARIRAKTVYDFWCTNRSFFYPVNTEGNYPLRCNLFCGISDETREQVEQDLFDRWKQLDNLVKRVEEGNFEILARWLGE